MRYALLLLVWLAGFVAGASLRERPEVPAAWSQAEVPTVASCWDTHDEIGTIDCGGSIDLVAEAEGLLGRVLTAEERAAFIERMEERWRRGSLSSTAIEASSARRS